MRKKINSVTKLQSLGILLVVIVHSFPPRNGLQYPPVIVWIQHFIPSFAMPLFMYISGFLFYLTNSSRDIVYDKFFKAKVKRLVVPYIVLSSLGYIIKINMSKYALRPINPGVSGYLNGLLYPQDNPIILFWFLPTLFLIFLIAPALKKIINIGSVTGTLAVLILLYFVIIYNPTHINILNISVSINYLFYFYLGCVVCNYFKEQLHRMGSWYIVLALLGLLVFTNSISETWSSDHFRVLIALIGIGFSISLTHFIDKFRPTVFRSFDGYFYQIFLLSWFSQVSVRLMYQMQYINYIVTIISMIVAGLYIPVLAAKIVEKHLPKLKVFIGLS